MGNRDHLGEFEHIVLLALVRLGDTAYGMTIRQEIAERIARNVAIGAVYTTLDRLEAKGLISSRVGPSTPERGGRAKRYFRIEAPGVKAIDNSWANLSKMRRGLGNELAPSGA
ncbi:MAG: helix-turn-helix transcriptional regulator [Proteobacteria bacterium]|nr:helix-turn-helix transcriptional regulator [Pseudomonadota bacterium]